MTVCELYKQLCDLIPSTLSCDWDNDGDMCMPEPEREVRRVLIALDITAEVVKTAIEGNYDLILSHHPLLFHGLKHLVAGEMTARKCIDLCRAGISAYSFHTTTATILNACQRSIGSIGVSGRSTSSTCSSSCRTART